MVTEVISAPEDFAFVDLQADKTNVIQSVIPMCHTMSQKGVPPNICLLASSLSTSPCFVGRALGVFVQSTEILKRSGAL